MFGIFDDAIDSVCNTVDDFMDDPIGTSVDMALSPVRDGLDVLEGLTEGELRVYAAARLGADVVAGMAVSEIIDALVD